MWSKYIFVTKCEDGWSCVCVSGIVLFRMNTGLHLSKHELAGRHRERGGVHVWFMAPGRRPTHLQLPPPPGWTAGVFRPSLFYISLLQTPHSISMSTCFLTKLVINNTYGHKTSIPSSIYKSCPTSRHIKAIIFLLYIIR